MRSPSVLVQWTLRVSPSASFATSALSAVTARPGCSGRSATHTSAGARGCDCTHAMRPFAAMTGAPASPSRLSPRLTAPPLVAGRDLGHPQVRVLAALVLDSLVSFLLAPVLDRLGQRVGPHEREVAAV